MSDKENEMNHLDAVPSTSLAVVKDERNQIASSSNVVVHNNNLQVNNSTSQTSVINIQGNGIHIGSKIQIFGSPQSQTSHSSASQSALEEIKIRKTRSISELLKNTETLSGKYLDIFAENFGERWEQVPVLLEIDNLKVERMFVDHFNRGGSREVVYQILYDYFQERQDRATVGWFARFLWENNFRPTIYNVSKRFKLLKEIEMEEKVVLEGEDRLDKNYL